MECIETAEKHQNFNDSDVKSPESPENFQKFIYELFEKNGILNDLRAYLRGHIVNVLKTANTGDTTPCQKNFTQRLERRYQAINILIAEYLLKLEFNYTLSVFVSEIPLANMIFGFTKALIKNTDEAFDLYFEDNDVWSILSCLGIECDSQHAFKISEMYQAEKIPLLLCIFKCTSLCLKDSIFNENVTASEENLTSDKSTDTLDGNIKKNSKKRKCRHYSFCKTCQYRVVRIKEKYDKRKTRFNETPKSTNSLDAGCFMKNLSIVEQGIINEMFEQLKSVYESEVDMIKEEQENTIRKSIASHTLQLQKQREELEESFKERELELFKNVDEKKKFLWNLAKSLRQQHDAMTKAMDDVKSETERLTAKEQILKSQTKEAEDLLRRRGEDMRKQISEELQTLEEHLQSMKRERDSINKEREKLEVLKEKYNEKELDKDLANELQVLKQFVEKNVKCLAEKGTVTENNLLNNEQRLIVNDLKQKNVNFMSNEAIYHDYQRASRSSSDREQSDHDDRDFCDHTDELIRLRNENHRLHALARQSDHIASLASERSRLHSEVTNTRPQTAPTLLQPFTSTHTNRGFVSSIGGGEQVNLFPQRRVFVPTDALPFIGVLKDRHTDSRRHFINQWRSLRRRVTPQIATTSKLIPREVTDRQYEAPTQSANIPLNSDQNDEDNRSCACNVCSEQTKKQVAEFNIEKKPREKSPKSVLREAKEKLRNNHSTRDPPPVREKSPNTTLREAKMRLRKLEIEAEAVERSYQDFRRRQRDDSLSQGHFDHGRKELEIKRSSPMLSESIKPEGFNFKNNDLDKYLNEYRSFDMPFKNKNAISEIIKPIPQGFSAIENKNFELTKNYLETPLTEFRKLYHTRMTSSKVKRRSMNILDEDSNEKPTDETSIDKTELKILQDNINKIYNLSPNMTTPAVTTPKSDAKSYPLENIPEVTKDVDENQENLLRVDIEKNCETNSIKMDCDRVLVVESSIDTKEMSESEADDKDKISTQMTILVSPKVKDRERSASPEMEKLTDNDLLNAIYHSQNKEESSVDMQVELSKRDSANDGQDEYPDDFSADVDNYNSRSDYDHSPISLAKDSEDFRQFWET
ncbi:intracellular protein transport protein USO1-like isoform X2 [Pieris rapae]|uniref:intracellular protein transport protein USO1-like isoform X2 n=1 Tax=Pieris rapae TaxID=64459 RepID=UPI001E27A4AD|nr:intracellular protein transport protein USO1-like isoform X2 [Pieris rapae]